MAARKILRWSIYVLAMPHILVARVVHLLKLEAFEADLSRCIEAVDKYSCSVPAAFIDALVVAEDHRSSLHPGIDPIGIFRALRVRLLQGQIQGASTIEQQFVRVVTARFERTTTRKLREQMLAVLLSSCRSKIAISSAYLALAFYGSHSEGLQGIRREFGCGLHNLDSEKVLHFGRLSHPSLGGRRFIIGYWL